MEMTVYRQLITTRSDGTVGYQGEDALPYADANLIMTADGLGGGAAIYHRSLDRNMLDPDRIMDVLFKGVYDDRSDERFVGYVKDSFAGLFALGDSYAANTRSIKKSGYFASRLAGAVIVHEMLYNDRVSPDRLIEDIEHDERVGKKEERLAKIGDHFAKVMREKLAKIASNANLIYETAFSGLALLGTTLCATICLERESTVEAICLTAGDSRPYVWTPSQGLRQLLPDEERDDGNMTNYISLTKDFHIRADHFSFEKPCVLFNATDGCFDSAMFLSQMAFEKAILEAGAESASTEEMASKLTDFFTTAGEHDDSSTLAMKIYGYSDFADFSRSAAERLERMQSEYLSEMPDALDRDYEAEYERGTGDLPARLALIKHRFEADGAVGRYCIAQLADEHKYLPYDSRIAKTDEMIAAQKEIIAGAFRTVTDTVADNLDLFCTAKEPDAMPDRTAELTQDKEKLVGLIREIKAILGKIYESGDEDITEECEAEMDGLIAYWNGLAADKPAENTDEYAECGTKADPGLICDLAKKVVSRETDTGALPLSPEDKAKLADALDATERANAEISRLEGDEKKRILTDSLKEYWDKNYAQIIEDIANGGCPGADAGLVDEARSVFDKIKRESDEIKEKAALQKKIFEKYDAVYGSLLRGI